MIALKFALGFFVIFIIPYLLISEKYHNRLSASLKLTLSFIASFSFVWLFFVINYFFAFPPDAVFYMVVFLCLTGVVYFLKLRTYQNYQDSSYTSLKSIFTTRYALLLLPLLLMLKYAGNVFTDWDAVVSWNRWAVEIFHDQYTPVGAAYPVLLPSLWSLFYKIQGTSEIWWTAKLTLFVIPVTVSLVLVSLFFETKDRFYLIVYLLLLPYLVWSKAVNGYMDVPVMLFGILSLVYVYRHSKENKNIYLSMAVILAGLAMVVKQAGIAFYIFVLCYVFFVNRTTESKLRLTTVFFLGLSYFLLFLSIYYLHANNPVSNLGYLKELSANSFNSSGVVLGVLGLIKKYISSPGIMYLLTPLMILSAVIYLVDAVRNNVKVYILLFVFYCLGMATWILYFSYDNRNTFWVQAFLLVMSSISISNYWQKISMYIHLFFSAILRKKKHIGFFFSVMVIIMIYNIDDERIYSIQEMQQSKIGDKITAQLIADYLKNSSGCVEVHTNDYFLQYNYYSKGITERIKLTGWGEKGIEQSVSHDCKEGRYFVFSEHYLKILLAEWESVQKMISKGHLKQKDRTNKYIYYIPYND